MARHPAHVMVALTVRVPRGQQGFWEVMRRLHRERGEFTAAQVDGASNVDSGTVHDFIRRLVKGGWLQVVREEPTTGTPRRVYRLAKDQPDAPRLRRDGTPAVRVGRGQEQMWRAMKMLDRWSVRELVMTGSTADCRVTLETAKAYVKHLHRCGYLKSLGGGLWRLKPNMNTGPQAPQIQRTDWVFDPNLLKAFGPEGEA